MDAKNNVCFSPLRIGSTVNVGFLGKKKEEEEEERDERRETRESDALVSEPFACLLLEFVVGALVASAWWLSTFRSSFSSSSFF